MKNIWDHNRFTFVEIPILLFTGCVIHIIEYFFFKKQVLYSWYKMTTFIVLLS